MQIKKICVNEYREVKSCKKGNMCKFRHNIAEAERSDNTIQQVMRERWEKVTKIKRKQDPPGLEDQLKQAVIVVDSLKELLTKAGRYP